MAKSLLIHIADPQRDAACWGTVDSDDPLHAQNLGEGSLAEAAAAAQGLRSDIALGSGAITLTRVGVPGGNGKRARAAIPFALEEQLADDVEDLHFALGPIGSDGEYPVAVIARQTLQDLMAKLTELGIYPRQVVPDVLMLPPGDSDEWEVLQTADNMLIRQGNYTGMWCPTSSAELMLSRLLREVGVDGPTQLAFYLAPGQVPPEVNTLVEQIPVQNSADALARGVNSPNINLLQGEFNQSAEMGKLWKPWRVPAALAACLLLLDVGSSVLQSNRLAAQEADQRAQMESLLKQTFPSVKRVRDPISRMRSELRKLKSGGAEGELMPLIAALSDAIQATPNTTMNSVNFRNGRCDVDMKTDSLQTLDKIKQSLDNTKGVKASIQSANQQDGAVRGRLRIEAG
ncbi:MAG: type II secretion system protein GspL [Granulosicoccaceae bacterium]